MDAIQRLIYKSRCWVQVEQYQVISNQVVVLVQLFVLLGKPSSRIRREGNANDSCYAHTSESPVHD